MPKGLARYKLYSIFFIICLISSSRFWEFGSSDEIDTNALPIVVLAVRIIPLLVLFAILFFDDLLHQCRALLNYVRPFYLVVLLFLGISFLSSFLVYGEVYSAWKTTELIVISYLGVHLYTSTRAGLFTAEKVYILRQYFSAVLIIAIVMIIAALLYPEIAFRFGSFQMESVIPPMNSNSLGFFALGSLLYFYFIPFKESRIRFVVIMYLLLLMILSLSRTAYIAFFFIIILFVLRNTISLFRTQRIRKTRLAGFTIVFLLSTSFLIFNGQQVVDSITKGQSTEELSNLSHRIFTWQAAAKSISQKPIFGYGLVAETRKLVEKYPYLVTYKQDSIGNAHSSIFEVLLAAGIFGGAPYLLFLFYLFIRSCWYIVFNWAKTKETGFHLFACSFMIAMFFRSLTGSALAMLSFDFISIILIYSLALFPWQAKHT